MSIDDHLYLLMLATLFINSANINSERDHTSSNYLWQGKRETTDDTNLKGIDNNIGFWYDIVENKTGGNHRDTEARRNRRCIPGDSYTLPCLCASVVKYLITQER